MQETDTPTIATRGWLERLWSSIADRGRPFADVPAAGLPPLERARRLPERSSPSAAKPPAPRWRGNSTRASQRLDGADRLAFFRFLAEELRAGCRPLRKAAEAWLAEPTLEAAARLADAAEPPRQELLRRMNMAPGGTAALVALREELLGLLRGEPGPARARRGPAAPPRLLVQPRLPGAPPDRLADARGGAGEAHPLRGGARDPGLGRPAPPPRRRTAAASPSSTPPCRASR